MDITEQLKTIEELQHEIVDQQHEIDAALAKVQSDTALVSGKITDLLTALGYYIDPGLENAVKGVSAQADSIDQKVPD